MRNSIKIIQKNGFLSNELRAVREECGGSFSPMRYPFFPILILPDVSCDQRPKRLREGRSGEITNQIGKGLVT